jgi:hypothetical protein
MFRMRACIVFIALKFAFAQPESTAVRANPDIAPAPDTFVVRTLRHIAPADPTPQSKEDEFREYVSSTIGILPTLGSAASAGAGQWMNLPPEWGQGMEGYARRFGSSFGFNAVRTTLTYGTARVFQEDNRYFASNQPNPVRRVLHALISPVEGRHPSGSDSFSVSSATGIAGASLISLAWSPRSWQGAANTAQSAGLTYGGVAVLNLIREFVPDIIRRIQR